MDIGQVNQIVIPILGCTAIWLVGRKEEWKRWGYIFGMLSQPFWLIETAMNKQWEFF